MPKIGEKSFDTRTIGSSIHGGKIKKADYDKYLKSLPDEADNAVETRPGDETFESPVNLNLVSSN